MGIARGVELWVRARNKELIQNFVKKKIIKISDQGRIQGGF
jgi:hypothetical protein